MEFFLTVGNRKLSRIFTSFRRRKTDAPIRATVRDRFDSNVRVVIRIGCGDSKCPGTVREQIHENRILIGRSEEAVVHCVGAHQQPANHISRRTHEVRTCFEGNYKPSDSDIGIRINNYFSYSRVLSAEDIHMYVHIYNAYL